MRFRGLSFVALLTLGAGPSPAVAQLPAERLSEASAQAIIDGCRAHAAENGYRLTIAIYDEGANLKAFSRSDSASLASADIAHWKAEFSAKWGRASKEMAEAVAGGRLDVAFAPGAVTFRGAAPIYTETGALIGGVGVSGATGEQDENCAKAGLAKAKLSFERPTAR